METKDRTCRNCGEELIGRSDKKFCCDKCKSEYNNKHNPKKMAFRTFCENEKEIKNGFINLKSIIQNELDELRKRKLLEDQDSSGNINLDYEMLKNHTILSQIKEIEGLLFN